MADGKGAACAVETLPDIPRICEVKCILSTLYIYSLLVEQKKMSNNIYLHNTWCYCSYGWLLSLLTVWHTLPYWNYIYNYILRIVTIACCVLILYSFSGQSLTNEWTIKQSNNQPANNNQTSIINVQIQGCTAYGVYILSRVVSYASLKYPNETSPWKPFKSTFYPIQ